MEHQDWLERGVIAGLFAAIGGTVGAVLRAWRKPSAPAEMIDAATTAATKMMAGLERRVDALEKENIDCRGENRQLWAYVTGLERLLRDAGIQIPTRDMPNTFTVIEGDHVTVMKPDRSR